MAKKKSVKRPVRLEKIEGSDHVGPAFGGGETREEQIERYWKMKKRNARARRFAWSVPRVR